MFDHQQPSARAQDPHRFGDGTPVVRDGAQDEAEHHGVEMFLGVGESGRVSLSERGVDPELGGTPPCDLQRDVAQVDGRER